MDRLSVVGGSWVGVLENWQSMCANLGEDFASYMPVTLPALQQESANCEGDANTGVFTFRDSDGEYLALCFLNATMLPGWSGKVLRVRHLTLSPRFDFGDMSIDQYASTLSDIVTELVGVADSEFGCKAVKIHFRSPADVAFFAQYASFVSQKDTKKSVEMVGSWLHITLE